MQEEPLGATSNASRTDPASNPAPGTESSQGSEPTKVCPTCGTEYPPEVSFCSRDGSVLRPKVASGDLVGRVIDARYRILERIGSGGMGQVYLAEHLRTRRRCAIKVISRSLTHDPEAVGRFGREATNASRITHANVAAVYDFGETDDGLIYLAMEFVDGEPLSVMLQRERTLPPARAVEIMRQVAEGLAAAHEMGIVHRDLKPSNIMMAQNRKGGDLVKIVDFGIAKAAGDEQQNLTRTGFVIGTPEYMSPEQLIGDPVDGRSDIYSMGCILYEMLTGEHAFGGATAQVITRRLTQSPPRPRARNPEIPKVLDDIVVQALGRTPVERFQSMEAIRDALVAAPAMPLTTGPRKVEAWLGQASAPTEQASPPAAPARLDEAISAGIPAPGQPAERQPEEVKPGRLTPAEPMSAQPVAPVRIPVPEASAPAVNVPAEAPRSSDVERRPRRAHREAGARNRWLVVGGVGVLVIAGLTFVGVTRGERPKQAGPSPANAVETPAQASPGSQEAARADALFQQGNFREAASAYRAAVAADQSNPAYLASLASTLNHLEQYREAGEAARSAIALNPGIADAHNALGNSLFWQERYADALAAHQEAVRLAPNNSTYHANLADDLYRLERDNEALAQAREAVRLDPSNAAAHNTLGHILFAQGNTKEAVAAYRAAVRLRPDDDLFVKNLASAMEADRR